MTETEPELHGDAIAIVGMACRLPGAADLERFWRNLIGGVESVTFLSDAELLAAGEQPTRLADPHYVRSPGAQLEGADLFDAEFFGIDARQAALMDPQHRVFLECAHTALENAGCDPARFDGAIALFAGVGRNHYLLDNLIAERAAMAAAGPFDVALANEKDFVPLRVSYLLDLRGPSVAVQTACSTSLVAVHLACQSLLSGEADVALAGGVSITALHQRGYVAREGGHFSTDGHCRPFDAAATGMVAGNGAGVVVLKRLADALANRDSIRALILGSAINNDGASKVGFAAPGVDGQRRVVRDALAIAGVAARSVSYVEAHGTGTPLGDMIEFAALSDAFGADTDERHYCDLGTVKGNVGHVNTAAGVAGMIKTVLALEHGVLPPTLNFTAPNPDIDFANSPFRIVTESQVWPRVRGQPRRACVHALAIGGTNAHVVLEEAPLRPAVVAAASPQLIVLSARTAAALERASAALAAALRERVELDLADVAFTLQTGRRAFAHRRALIVREADACAAALANGGGPVLTATVTRRDPGVALVLGAAAPPLTEREAMAAAAPAFAQALDECAACVGGHAALLASGPQAQLAALYALAHECMAWLPAAPAITGQGLGALAAACLNGAIALDVALAQAAGTTAAGNLGALVGNAGAGGERVVVVLDAQASGLAVDPGAGLVALERGAPSDLLEAMARLWLAGVAVRFDAIARPDGVRRVTLPTYPFERVRHWIEPATPGAPMAANASTVPSPALLGDGPMLYVPSWRRTPRPVADAEMQRGTWLVLADECGLADELALRLERAAIDIVRVAAGTGFADAAHGAYSVRPAAVDDWVALLARLDGNGRRVRHVVHAFSVHGTVGGDALADGVDRGYASVSALAAALAGRTDRVVLDVVVDTLLDVTGTDAVRPERATVLGACRVIPHEHRHLPCRLIDVHLGSGLAAAADHVANECTAAVRDTVVAYRGRCRWVQSFEPLPAPAAPVVLPSTGAYLVTGGTGHVGLALAEQLVALGARALVLVARTEPPADGAVARRIAALSVSGAEVVVANADVTDREAIRAVAAAARSRFAAIRGAVHAAGASHDDSAAPYVAAVDGARVLIDALRLDALAVFVLTACLTRASGGADAGAHAAASASVEALALSAAANAPLQAIVWDWWDETHGLTVAQARAAFGVALASHERCVLVSRHELLARGDVAAPVAAPVRRTDYVPPRTDLEKAIAAVWQEVLGIDRVGLDDSFFDVGGRSVTALRVAAQLRDRIGLDVPLRQLFEAPTIAKLAAFVEASRWIGAPTTGAHDGDRDEIEF